MNFYNRILKGEKGKGITKRIWRLYSQIQRCRTGYCYFMLLYEKTDGCFLWKQCPPQKIGVRSPFIVILELDPCIHSAAISENIKFSYVVNPEEWIHGTSPRMTDLVRPVERDAL